MSNSTVTYRYECDDCGHIEIGSEWPDSCPACIEAEEDRLEEKTETSGATSLYHGPNWEKTRRRILERDGYTCQADECNITHEEHQKRDDLFPPDGGLHIHHIVKARRFEEYNEANQEGNLISLCADHHRIAERNGWPL